MLNANTLAQCNYELYLVNNVASNSTVCYLRVYCQTVNIVARGNSHCQLGMADKKISHKLFYNPCNV